MGWVLNDDGWFLFLLTRNALGFLKTNNANISVTKTPTDYCYILKYFTNSYTKTRGMNYYLTNERSCRVGIDIKPVWSSIEYSGTVIPNSSGSSTSYRFNARLDPSWYHLNIIEIDRI